MSIRMKAYETKKREEMAEEDEHVICEDEDDDCGIEICSDEEDYDEDYDQNEEDECHDLYENRLDDVDEILHLGNWLQTLQTQSGEMYNFLMGNVAD